MDEQRALTAISPLDGRYAAKCDGCRELFSEQGLIKRRVLVEVRWLQFLAKRPEIADFPTVSPVVHDWLDRLVENFGYQEASRGQGDRKDHEPRRQGGRVLHRPSNWPRVPSFPA